MKFSSTTNIVHELEPKKWIFGSSGWAKHNIVSGCLLSDQLSKSVVFGGKLRYFTDQNRPEGGPHANKF